MSHRHQLLWGYVDLRGYGQQVRLMPFQECDQRRKQRRIIRLVPKLVCPDSGQVQEPLGPTFVAERCRKGGKGNSQRIIWRL